MEGIAIINGQPVKPYHIGRWILADGYGPVVRYLESRFASYLPVSDTPDPEEGYPAKGLTYFPYIFPNIWPVLAVSALPPEPGRPVSSDVILPIRAVRLGVRIHFPSVTQVDRGNQYEDGRATAKRVTDAVFSNWMQAFIEDDELRSWVNNLGFGSILMGDRDTVGNPFYQPGTGERSRLWIHATEVVLEL